MREIPTKRQYSSEQLCLSVLKKNAGDSYETAVLIRAAVSLSSEEKCGRFLRNSSAHLSIYMTSYSTKPQFLSTAYSNVIFIVAVYLLMVYITFCSLEHGSCGVTRIVSLVVAKGGITMAGPNRSYEL
jgi:hypothetical protein